MDVTGAVTVFQGVSDQVGEEAAQLFGVGRNRQRAGLTSYVDRHPLLISFQLKGGPDLLEQLPQVDGH